MSVTSGFFNSLSGDRKYDAIQISSMFDGLITDGIYNGYLESFMVTASSPASMVVTVGEGRCWFNHTWTLNDAPLPLTLDVGDVVLNRIDTIVIDVDSTDTVRACTIKVVKGTPSSQAVRPTLENTETHHQYPLCDISVPAGATTITQSNITNRRGTSDCPFVATLMESVDVDDLLIQWESQWNDWMTDRADAMDTWTAEQQEAFTTWFQTVQDILDENTAGNLLNRINHRTGINATATYSAGVVAITAPDDAGEILTFVAPSDFLSSDTYTLNGEALTITDLNGEALDDSWKKDSPVTITVSGGKAFFKAGGSGKNDTLPPLLGNMTVEVVEGDENDTYTIKMDKLILDKTTEMVGGAQLEWGEEMPAKPGKGTGGIKTWTREEIITTGKPYDGLYLGDVTPSDAVTETLIYLPENDGGSVKLVPFIVLSTDYLGGVAVLRKNAYGNVNIRWHGSEFTIYSETLIDDWISSTYINSILSESVVSQIVDIDWPVLLDTGSVGSINRKAVLLSGTEYGASSGISDLAAEGTAFPYFSSNSMRKTVNDDGEETDTWTRSVATGKNRAFYVSDTGSFTGETYITRVKQIRPAFILPKDFKIQQRPDGSYTVWNEQGLLTLGDIEVSTDAIETTVNAAEMYKSSTGPKAIITELSYDKKNYNKTDGGLLVRKELIKDSIVFSAGPGNYLSSYAMIGADEWATAEIGDVTRTDFVLLDSFKKILMSTPIKYRENGTVTKEVTKKGFLLSVDEVGNNHIWGDSATGEEIERYWNQPQNRISYYGNTKKGYWLRDGASANKNVYTISASGVPTIAVSSNSYGIKVACVVPLTAPIRALADGTYDLVPEDPSLTPKQVKVPDIPVETPTGTPIQLKDVPVSNASIKTTIYLKENGEDKPFLYLDADYETSGRGLLLKESVVNQRVVQGSALYESSNMHQACLNWFDTLDNAVKSKVEPVSITYRWKSRSSGYATETMEATAFLLTMVNYGYPITPNAYPGKPLPYFNGNGRRQAFIDGTQTISNYYTRDIETYNSASYYWYGCVKADGTIGVLEYNGSYYIRPAITLSPDVWLLDNGDGTYTFVGDKPVDDTPVITHTVEVPHGQKVVFRQFTQNQKKQFQTMLVGAVYPPLGDVEPAFKLPEFTGNHAIFGDETAGRIEIYEAGKLTLYPGNYDIFSVGGGAAGRYGRDNDGIRYGGGGGGSGYTKTVKGYKVSQKLDLDVVIGAGGGTEQNGSETKLSMYDGSVVASAGGGQIGNGSGAIHSAVRQGGTGGSGGGSGYYVGGTGGSDGGNGGPGKVSASSDRKQVPGGTGQGTTTRAFEDPEGVLYAGGGAGAGNEGNGGGGPGGGGGENTPGTPNTGSGGGGGIAVGLGPTHNKGTGGSGIMIIRWNNVAS